MVKLVTSFVYEYPINRVYEAFRDMEVHKEILKDFLQDMKFPNGKHFSDKGIKFSFTWKNIFKLNCEIVESINELNFKYYKHHITCVWPIYLKYFLHWYFYWDSVDETTLLVVEFEMHDSSLRNVIDENLNFEEQIIIYKKFEEYLQINTKGLEQTESILINKNVNHIWEIITNWNLFLKISPLLGEYAKFCGNQLHVGTKFKLLEKNNENYFQVKKIIMNENEDREYHLECYDGSPCLSIKLSIFKLKNIADKLTFLEFQHIFIDSVKFNYIHRISKEKKRILAKLKKYFN